MQKRFVHFTFFFFFLTALSGVWMRLHPLIPSITFPYDHVLHGHSHVAILGWAFLGVVVIFLTIYWNELKSKTEAKIMLATLFLITFIMFITFLYQGYGLYSIIMSTLHIFAEYWTVSFIFRSLKQMNTQHKTGQLFIKASLISLVISSFGPFSLGAISSVGLKDSHWFDIAIYFYLHFQYNGWLFLALIGLFIIIFNLRKVSLNKLLLKKGFWLYIIALFPGFFASVLWVEHTAFIAWLARLGTIGQWIAVICILAACLPARKAFVKHASQGTMIFIDIIFVILLMKSTMELGLTFPIIASLVFETRSVIIGYLHFTLLGFVSLFILVQYAMTGILPWNQVSLSGFFVFMAGFVLNELLLFTQSLFNWFNLGTIPLYIPGLLTASVLLLLGIILLWVSFSEKRIVSALH